MPTLAELVEALDAAHAALEAAVHEREQAEVALREAIERTDDSWHALNVARLRYQIDKGQAGIGADDR